MKNSEGNEIDVCGDCDFLKAKLFSLQTQEVDYWCGLSSKSNPFIEFHEVFDTIPKWCPLKRLNVLDCGCRTPEGITSNVT